MAKSETGKHPVSRRAQQHAAMLEAARARPGVRESMRVYGGWQEKDRGLDAHRAATKTPARIVTTNSSNAH